MEDDYELLKGKLETAKKENSELKTEAEKTDNERKVFWDMKNL